MFCLFVFESESCLAGSISILYEEIGESYNQDLFMPNKKKKNRELLPAGKQQQPWCEMNKMQSLHFLKSELEHFFIKKKKSKLG